MKKKNKKDYGPLSFDNSPFYKQYFFRKSLFILITILLSSTISCKKLISIPPPTTSIVTQEVFKDSTNATDAIFGIYKAMLGTNGGLTFGNGTISLYCGESADEYGSFTNGSSGQFYALFTNTISVTTSLPDSYFWASGYAILYKVNACIDGINASQTLSVAAKNQLLGEAYFFRAFINFYLVNCYGDIPLSLTSDYSVNALLSRSSKATVYSSIIADLINAQKMLPANYSISNGEKTRVNQYAATALLARVYLYTDDYKDALIQSSSIINSNVFTLSALNSVFLKNSSEAILQWNLNVAVNPWNATPEEYNVTRQLYYIAPQLLSAFENGDQRKTVWLNSATHSGTIYYYPNKYKVGSAQASANAPATEYYMVLRLAEQYLIRSECEYQNNDLSNAITDLNIIRSRAGLPALPSTLTASQVFSAIMQERRVEFFGEWGNRWLDLKRTGQIDAVMSVVTPQKSIGTTWNSYQQLYPIPLSEIKVDPNLTQNPGY